MTIIERAFSALILHPGSTVSELAIAMGEPVDMTYRALRSLCTREVVLGRGFGRRRRTYEVAPGLDPSTVKFGRPVNTDGLRLGPQAFAAKYTGKPRGIGRQIIKHGKGVAPSIDWQSILGQ